MVPETEKIDFRPIEIPRVRRGFSGYVKIGAAVMALGGVAWAWETGYRPPMFSQSSNLPLNFVEIDRGDVEIVVVEQGTVESAHNTTVRCLVEALIGTVGGATGGTSKGSGASGGSSGQASGGSQGSSGGAAPASGAQGGGAASGKGKSTTKAGSPATSKTGGSTTGSSSSSTGSGSSGSSSSTAGGGASSSGSSSGSSGTTSGSSKPVIRSFTYQVTAHVPLRPVTPKAADTTTQKKAQSTQGGGGGRGGGRGRRGGGGGMGGMDEKPGSTRILEIKPEGSRVKAGDVVAKLDGAAYEDEEQVQRIRYLQAKSYVEQANSMLEVAEITLKEYRDGIYPQDLQLVRQYIQTCQIETDRLGQTLEWSRDMRKKGFRTSFQVRGDGLAHDQSKIALAEATGMLDRLVKQTGPKIIKALEANVLAIESDKHMQDASFSLEEQRLKRIRKNIEHCTVRAPGDGIVVYVNQTDRWGTVTAPIDEGVTLRQDQPIFTLPDPNHMRVKARVNESKVTMIHTGQRVIITVDAFPDRPLRGAVGEVTAISTPLNASDVRVYYANVEIDQGFDGLRPGLSAEVAFNVDSRPDVTRVPLESVRWARDQPYVALYDRESDESRQYAWHWRPIELGLSDTQFAEVTSGLQVGDRIVSAPRALPAPTPETIKPPATDVARLSAKR